MTFNGLLGDITLKTKLFDIELVYFGFKPPKTACNFPVRERIVEHYTKFLKRGKNLANMSKQLTFFPRGSTAQFWALAASIKLSSSFQLLDLGQLAGLLGRLISSSKSIC
jgi:hypothetical protein